MSYIHKKGSFSAKDLKEPAVRDLITGTSTVFGDAIKIGFGDNDVPKKMKEKLLKDIYLFSGLKTFAQLKEVSSKLLDENQKIKPYNLFEREVLAIHNTYNKNYLQTEYQYAIGASEMASKWNDLSQNKGAILQYRTANDNRVRDTHRTLHNTTLPLSDSFWNSYYPPNGWRCRCNVVEVAKGKYDISDSVKAQSEGEKAVTGKNEIFKFNPGKQGIIFPPQHPYRKIQNAGAVEEELKAYNKNKNLAVYELPLEQQYKILYTDKKTGGTVRRHILDKRTIDEQDDYDHKAEVGIILAKDGFNVDILPTINHREKEARKKLMPGYEHPTANPDFFIKKGEESLYLDMKRASKLGNILTNANDASINQDAHAIIYDVYFKENYTKEQVIRKLKDIYLNNKNLYTKSKVFMVYKGEVLIQNKTTIGE